MEKNREYQLKIEGYTAEGAGVARLEGMVVFVPGAARGDLCLVRIVKVLKTHAFGKLMSVLEPGPGRIEPDCPVYDKCGGCCYRHISYEEELWAKGKKVQDALNRIGGLALTEAPEVVGSPQLVGYRNKAQFPVALDESGKAVFGFYRSRSHDVAAVDGCAIQDPRANALARAVCAWMDQTGAKPYEETTGSGLVRHIFVRTGETGSQLCLVCTGAKLPRSERLVALCREAAPDLRGLVVNINAKNTNVILGAENRTLWGEDRLTDTLCGHTFSLSPHSFYQVNHAQTAQLYGQALRYAEPKGKTVLDLYCGIGTITLALAREAQSVIGAEIVPQAIADANENAAENRVDNVRFLCADAGEAAQQLAAQGLRPDVIVCDPPRKGMDGNTIDAILKMNPDRVVYVSCDCASLARDIALLKGYTLTAVKCFDMFPRTHHIETVALLQRTESAAI